MGLVTGQTKTLQIPGEEAEVVIQRLSHKELKAAAKIRQQEGVGDMKALGAELVAAFRQDAAAASDKLSDIERRQAATYTNYDRDTVLQSGLVSWTYDAELPQGTDRLDEPTADFLHREIFEFSRPESPEARKNG